MEGVYLLVGVLVAASAFGLWRARTDGRLVPHAAADGTGSADGAAGSAGDAALGGAVASVGPGVPADDSEPLVVDGRPIGETDHSVVPRADGLGPADLGAPLGERATLVQFSSAFCTPCRATRVVLGDVARMLHGVAHVEIDAESHLDLVRRLDVTRTPTVLVLDATGTIRRRATGAPRKADVIAALGEIA